ncbi:MAG: MotA/TolQ/ExbB proton channel family protein, partial [Myxococcaceae bacterium]
MSASTVVSHLVDVVITAAPHGGGGSFKDTIVTFFKDGGPFMFVNIFWLAAAVAVIVERIVTLMFRYNLNAPPFMEQVTKLVLTGNVDRAVKLCGAAPNA